MAGCADLRSRDRTHLRECTGRGRLRRVVAVLLAITSVGMTLAYWSAADGPTLIALAVPRGTLQVALADTAEHRAAGLSNRDAITHDGMLLQWDAPGRHPIWMSEMRFALDLVWLDAEGRVLSVLPNVPPCTSTPCPLYEPAGSEASMAVLELPAGKAAIHGLVAGAVIRRQ